MEKMEKQCIDIMYVLHEIKHGGDMEGVYNYLKERYSNWREVEFFDPKKYNSKKYLFDIVLRNRRAD